MRRLTIDFETYSRADLLKIGAWKYAADFSTGMLCLGFKVTIDGRPQPTRVLTEQQIHAIDPELLELAQDPEVIFCAHNASFEQAMWHFHMVPAGYPALPPERWHDTMAVCAMKAVPLGLDAAVSALELPIRKDMEGHRLMLVMCKPDRLGGWSQHNDLNLKRLYEYNVGDVDAQDALYVATKGLGPSERHTWVLDQRINQRGIKIDREFVDACMDVLDQVRVPMTERFRELTGLNPTQREKVLNWVNDQGVPLGDMKKATLDAILDPGDEFGIEDFAEPLPYHVHEVITLRRSLASSSVAKLKRMLDCAGMDGRVRYATQYHGARTGRDAGRLIQIQNYPRGEIGTRQGLTADILADAILSRDVSRIRELWGSDIFSAIISSLRSCIVPEKGKVLVGGDYAQVEAKNLLSRAGQHDKAEMLHVGADAYAEMAAMIFKRPINKVDNPLERQVGKNCLAADTMVLTHNGWKPIIRVQDTDLLWDGEDWVIHQGLTFKGNQETLNLSGLRLTANHPVYIGDRWRPSGELTPGEHFRALEFARVHGPYSDTLIRRLAALSGLSVNAIVETGRFLWNYTTFNLDGPRDATGAPSEKPFGHDKKDTGIMRTYARILRTAPGSLTEYPPSSVVALIRNSNTLRTMAVEEFASSFPTDGRVSRTYSRLKGGITRIWKSIVSTITDTMPQEISDLLQKLKMLEIVDGLAIYKIDWMQRLKKLGCCEPVYDLVNAGPNHRFTVMTCDGPLIVHNCVMGNGYGLGPVGFRARFCPKESIDLAMLAVNTYRREFAPMVPKFWYGLWQASVDAVWCNHAKTYSYQGIEFRREGDYLSMRLASGRKLWYHRPWKATTYDPQGNERPAWSYMSYQGKKFRRHQAWHGMITADAIQGEARDLVMGAMKRAEAAGLNTIFKVHDELVFEEFDRPDLETTVRQIMEDVEPWALELQLKIKAEVGTMLRYTK